MYFVKKLSEREKYLMKSPFGVANQKTMLKVNNYAYQGNRLLGPGINILKGYSRRC